MGPSVGTGSPLEDKDAAEAPPELLHLIEQATITKGYALVVGQPDARLAEALARETDLHVICVPDDSSRVQRERARLLSTTDLYGSRLVVQHIEDTGSLPYAPYFANVVVASGRGAARWGRDIYRVLRPCGGLVYFHQVPRRRVEEILRDSEVPAGEVCSRGGSVHVVRGKLPGAFDWDSEVSCDQRVKWPLELLWFGGPGPARAAGRHECGTPRAANGRYFILGADNTVIAMDAYNGCELWSRQMPAPSEGTEGLPEVFSPQTRALWQGDARPPESIAADDEHVYLRAGSLCYQLDAQTGARQKVMPLKDAPERARRWGRLPARSSEDRADLSPRPHPLTGQESGRPYVRTAGCGGVVASAAADFFRPATLGFYDYVDDSGLRNFGGVRPSCGSTAGPTSLMPALGLLISSEGSVGCSCSYNFQCSLALVPSATGKNEDWAVFPDAADAEGERVQRAALNLAAPGDRRDEEGVLWLGIPRPGFGAAVGVGGAHMKTSLGVPFHMLCETGFEPYRFDSYRVTIAGTARPWVYASGYRGLRRAALDLAVSEPGKTGVSLACEQPPVIDGRLSDPYWNDAAHVSFGGEKAWARIRHDEDNLYIAYERLPRADGGGKDAPAWNGGSVELYITDQQTPRILHFGVSASGARYDGLWNYMFDIPRLDGLTIDGNPDDWQDGGLWLNVFENGRCRVGWDEDGLLLLVESSGKRFGPRDSGGMGFFAVKPGTEAFLQLNVSAGERTYEVHRGPGESVPALEVAQRETEQGYLVEARFPWDHLNITPALGAEVGFPVIFYPGDRLRPRWGEYVARDLKNMCRLRLARQAATPVELDYGDWLRIYTISRANFLLEEDADWNGDWSAVAGADPDALAFEIAIPWDTLTATGFSKNLLQLKFDKSGKVRTPPPAPRWNRGQYEKEYYPPLRLWSPDERAKTYTVRLHFVETGGAAAGERVFDVRLQGETVLGDFDIARAAGGRFRAVVEEFRGISAGNTITLELIPKSDNVTSTTTPLISGIEVELQADAAGRD